MYQSIDILVFIACAGSFWLLFAYGRKEPEQQVQPLEINFLPNENPAISGRFSRFERWFQQQVLMARLPVPNPLVPLLMVCTAAMLGAATYVATDDTFMSAVAAIAVLLCLAMLLIGLAQWRVRQFRRQLPLALDIMAGAVRSGESLQQAVCLLADTMQEPAKTEFVRCRNQLDMGLSLKATMHSLASRIGSLDARIFATTLAVHRETGGQLTETLKRMSGVIRSRFEYERHLKATTGMGRMSVMVVAVLAWLIFFYVILMRPEYGRDLLEQPLGQQMLMLALVLELIGCLWAFGLMRAKY